MFDILRFTFGFVADTKETAEPCQFSPAELVFYGNQLVVGTGLFGSARWSVPATMVMLISFKGSIPRPLQAGGSGCVLRWDSAQIETFIAEQIGKIAKVQLVSETIG